MFPRDLNTNIPIPRVAVDIECNNASRVMSIIVPNGNTFQHEEHIDIDIPGDQQIEVCYGAVRTA